MPSLLVTDSDRFPAVDRERERVEAAGLQYVVMAGHGPADLVRYGRDAAAILVYSAQISADIVPSLPQCRVLARCGSGYDNIDVDAASRHGIAVTYVPGYGSIDVAEHALALLLACARRLVTADRAIQAGRWPTYLELGTMHRLAGQVLGLLGFGRIAQALAQRAQVLGLRVIAHDPLLPPDQVRFRGVEPVSASELLASADFLSLHLPLTINTRHWLDDARLAQLKPSAVVINTSRGEIIDQDALEAALAGNHLAGAGLDVLEHEPPAPTTTLLRSPNVLLTPHSAAFTEEALEEVRTTALDDALAVLAGRRPKHPAPGEPSP